MKKILSILILVIISSFSSLYGQKFETDKLLNDLKNAEVDTQKITVLRNLGKHYQGKNNDSSLHYFRIALDIAKNNNLYKDEGDLLSEMGKTYFYKGNYDTSIDLLQNAEELFQEKRYNKGLLTVQNNIGVIYFNLGEYDKALEYWEPTLQQYKNIGDSSGIATAYTNLGVVHYSKTNYEKALENYLKALNIRERIKSKKGIASINAKIALIYNQQQEYAKALAHNRKALKAYKELNDQLSEAKIMNNMANLYSSMDSSSKSFEYHMKSLEMSRKTENKRLEAINLNNLGNHYNQTGNHERAFQYFHKALKINKQLGRKNEIANTYHNLGNLNYEMGENNKAINYYKNAVELAKEIGIPEKMQENYFMLSTVYSNLGNYKKAWQYQNRYIHIKDSIYKKNRTKHIEELKTKYETEKKEKEIALLKKDKKIQDSELKQSAIIRNSLIAIIALVLIFTVIYYIRFKKTVRLSRKLQEKNQEIERQKEEIAQQSSNLREINSLLITKNEEIKKHQEHLQEVNEMKDRIFSIIGHDLKSPVATLKNSFELLMKGDYDKDKIREFHEMMYENISPIYNLLENLLLWAKNQQNDITFKPKQCNLQEIINDNIKLLNNNAKQKQITLEAEYDGSLEAEVDYNMISTVVRNLLSNAIKFSYPGNDVLVKAHSGNNKVIISVNDKGMGISEEELNKILHTDQHFSKRGTEKEKGSGLGLNICKKFIQLHNGTFNAFSEEGTGSQFIFTIPKSQFNAV